MFNKKQFKILIIEDDPTIREGIETVFDKEGYQTVSAKDGMEGSRLFKQESPDLVITDLKLPGKSGLKLLKEFIKHKASLPVILISAFGTIDLAVNALKSGARDFIAKPFSIDELRLKVSQILEDLQPGNLALTADIGQTFHGLIGSSRVMGKIFQKIRQVAEVDSPVLITGESGTGKELVARAIHGESKRAHNEFLAVNCGALTETLLASELFGHEKGAFTGAVRLHKGVFEQAHGGTILLDEIGDISPQMQVKLLRVLQGQAFQRVGGTGEIKTDVRILAATNRDLKEAIRNKVFREDLFYRINVIDLHIPPLRDRKEDITELIHFIAAKKCHKLHKPVPEWNPDALTKIEQYAWPGNIRDLENFLERVLIFSSGPTITGKDIYFDRLADTLASETNSLTDKLGKTELEMIKNALAEVKGVKQKAARLLGIKTSTLYYKMNKYGISSDE
ncbi:MAG: sigma-54 dependent transcriptional regulator [Candidatus Neomarinimicrobiota bacterium]